MFARAELAVSGGEIRPGEWNSRFVAAKEYAEAHNTPMLAIWSSTGCGWCRLLREACQNAEFVRWQNERKLVMVACHDKDQPDDYACWQFIRNETGAFP